jgi:hypothetical protein
MRPRSNPHIQPDSASLRKSPFESYIRKRVNLRLKRERKALAPVILGETGITVNAIAPTIVKTEGLVARTPTEGPSVDDNMKLLLHSRRSSASAGLKMRPTYCPSSSLRTPAPSQDRSCTWTAASVEAAPRRQRRVNVSIKLVRRSGSLVDRLKIECASSSLPTGSNSNLPYTLSTMVENALDSSDGQPSSPATVDFFERRQTLLSLQECLHS